MTISDLGNTMNFQLMTLVLLCHKIHLQQGDAW